ncbi:intermembrane transport protein PqiB [Orrella sp. 11846]|uniref:PqiB family protein n=1 Tax=Orrella sp. 11846 TaxID=3409913 RepID=UPI003B5A765B
MSSEESVHKHALPVPVVRQKKRRSQALIWLIPVLAALIGLSIVWHEISNRGPMITISFQSASGLEEGKTQIRFRDVVVGLVENIRLSDARDVVIVDARLDKDAQGLANETTSFWVVRPTIGLDGVSGLTTLLSGSYIEADTDRSFSVSPNHYDFVGLESPPPIKSDRPGKAFRLRSDSLGSLVTGAPIYFLRIPVGLVSGFELDQNGHYVDIDIFIDAPYDQYVHGNTRFWNASGIRLSVGADGVQFDTESLASLVSGGLAFANFGSAIPLNQDAQFKLYADRTQAERVPTGRSISVVMRFDQSGRGLEAGAPVVFQGLSVGHVDQIELQFDPDSFKLFTVVKATLYPSSLGESFASFIGADRSIPQALKNLQVFVDKGLRAQIKTNNLLSGSSQISLGIFPEEASKLRAAADLPFEIPTLRSETLDDIQKKLSEIVNRISDLPLDTMGEQLTQTLKSFETLAQTLDRDVTPQIGETLKKLNQTLKSLETILNSSGALPGQVGTTLDSLNGTIRATRALIDELRAAPNSVIFGVPETSYSRQHLGAEGQ